MHATRRQEGLIVVALDDELLVYDVEAHRGHCLNAPAAIVWRHCDGQTSVAELGDLLRREMNADLGDEYVWYALRRFGNSRLLASAQQVPPQAARCTRRELLRRLAAGGIATAALPTVMSVIAPATLQAQASCLPAGSLCDRSSIPCCPGLRCRGLPPGSPGMCR